MRTIGDGPDSAAEAGVSVLPPVPKQAHTCPSSAPASDRATARNMRTASRKRNQGPRAQGTHRHLYTHSHAHATSNHMDRICFRTCGKNDCKFGGLKPQKCISSSFWRLGVCRGGRPPSLWAPHPPIRAPAHGFRLFWSRTGHVALHGGLSGITQDELISRPSA